MNCKVAFVTSVTSMRRHTVYKSVHRGAAAFTHENPRRYITRNHKNKVKYSL